MQSRRGEVEQKAVAALADVTPAELRDRSAVQLWAVEWWPAEVACTAGEDAGVEGVHRRAAGVQLLHAGLTLTEAVSESPPWPDAEREAERDEGNLDVLTAEVMVGKAIEMLAGTPAAGAAVEAVRAFAAGAHDESAADFRSQIFLTAVAAGQS